MFRFWQVRIAHKDVDYRQGCCFGSKPAAFF